LGIGGRHFYVLGLLASQAVLAIIIVPVIVRYFDSVLLEISTNGDHPSGSKLLRENACRVTNSA
jgi:hypothetical protein